MVERVLAVAGLAGAILVALALTGALQHPAVPGAGAAQYCPVDQYSNPAGDCFDDSTPPTITSTQTPAANANGWNNTNVTVTFTGADEAGGSGVQSIACSTNGGAPTTVNGSTRSFTFTGPTTGTTLSCTAKDFAGNVSDPAARTVRVDKTLPVISVLSRLPAQDPYGWNDTDVTVTWSCVDPLSGPVSPTVSRTITTNGANQTATGICTDRAGNNSVPSTVFNINIDKTVVLPTGGPPNDNAVNATDITSLPFSDPTADTTNATHETHEPNCTFPENRTIWYRFTAAELGFARVRLTDFDPNAVPTIGIWRASPSALQFVSCQVAGLPAGIDVFPTNSGARYYVQIGSATTGTGPFTVNLERVFPPPNDAFENATPINSLPFSGSLDLTAATTQPNEPLRPGGSFTAPLVTSAWYRFTPTQDTPLVFGGTSPSPTSRVLAVYTGSALFSLTQVAFNTGVFPVGSTSFFSPVIFNARAGTTYYFQIGSTFNLPGGDSGLVVDLDRAIVFAGQTPAANANGWNNTNVTLNWQCSDVIPFVTSFPITITSEGANQSGIGLCISPFAATPTDTQSGINIDKTLPAAPTATADRAPEYSVGDGWFKDAVTVHFTPNGDPNGANGTAGSGVDTGSIPAPITFDTQGSHTASGTVLDLAGNESAPGSLTVQVDTDAPELSATFTNADGSAYTPGTWTNQAVTATFQCTDSAGSGVASFSSPKTVSTEGGSQSVTGSCTDNVGHPTTQIFSGIDIDLTPPEGYLAFDPVAHDVQFFGRDQGGSGLATPNPVVPTTVSGNGSQQTRTYTVLDGAGNRFVLVLQAKPGAGALQVTVTSLRYNAAAATPAPFTSLSYDWSTSKDGSLKSLDQALTIGKGGAQRQVVASYDANKNQTKLTDSSGTSTRAGLVLVRVASAAGALVFEY